MTELNAEQVLSELAGSDRVRDLNLDADVATLLGHGIEWRSARFTSDAFPAIHWKAPHNYGGMSEPCPQFSNSLDAVRVLLGGYFQDRFSWTMQAGYDGAENKATAEVTLWPTEGHIIPPFVGTARNPAAALCIAAIRAILAEFPPKEMISPKICG